MKYKLFFLAAFLVHGFAGFSQKTDARELMQEYRYREAIEWLQQQPENRENLLLKAESYEKLYNYPAAIAAYKKLLNENPSDVNVVISLAEVTAQSGDADASLNYWTQANQLSPNVLFLQTKKAMAHYRASDWKGAISASKEVFQKDSIPVLLRMTGDAQLYTLNGDSALWYYSKAIEKNPADYLAVSKKANIYYSAKLYDEAISLTETYLQTINPDQKNIAQLNGMAHYSAGNYKQAIDRLKKNILLGDSAYTTNYFLGMSYYASKLYFDATKWLGNAYRQDSADINLMFYYGSALARTYDRKKGIRILMQGVDKIAEMNEMMYDFDLSLADAHIRSNNPAKAIEYYQSAFKRQPDKSPILYNMAHAYEMLNDSKNAIAYYERFLKTAPKEMKIDASPVENEDVLKMSTSESFYRAAFQRIEKLKEEQFFKEGKK